jgi:hypothetical protein
LPGEAVIPKSLMNVVFSKRAELSAAVGRVKHAGTRPQRNAELAEALRLACENLMVLADFRFTALHGQKKARKKARKAAMSAASDDGYAECALIGEALDRFDNGEWHLKEDFTAMYVELRRVFAETAGTRFADAKTPISVVSLRDKVCDLARKAKEQRLGAGEYRRARIVIEKALQVVLVFGGLIGLEQDFPGLLKDVGPAVEVMVHGLDQLITQPEFLVDLPMLTEPAPAASPDLPKPVTEPDAPSEAPTVDPSDEPARSELDAIFDLFNPSEPDEGPGRLKDLEDPLEDARDPFRPKWTEPEPPELDELDEGPAAPGL